METNRQSGRDTDPGRPVLGYARPDAGNRAAMQHAVIGVALPAMLLILAIPAVNVLGVCGLFLLLVFGTPSALCLALGHAMAACHTPGSARLGKVGVVLNVGLMALAVMALLYPLSFALTGPR